MEKKLLRLLVIDDSPDDTELVSDVLRRAGYMLKSQRVQDMSGLQTALGKGPWDLIISEYDVPHLGVPTVLDQIKRAKLELPFIVITGSISDDEMSKIIHSGAHDIVFKNQVSRLPLIIERELQVFQARAQQLETEQKFQEIQDRYRALIDGSCEAICYSHEGMHTEANSNYLSLFGYDNLNELKEMPVLNLIDKTDQARFKEILRKPGKASQSGSAREFMAVKNDGTRFPVEIVVSPVNVAGEVWQQISVSNASKNKNIENKLQYLNQRDGLTGLYNRHYFLQELSKVIEQTKAGAPAAALLYIDVNQLNTINQRFGLAAGDRLLIKLARVLREKLQDKDIVARFDGDEFTALLVDTTEKQAHIILEVIERAIEETPFSENGKPYDCRCTLSLAVIDANTENTEQLLSQVEHTYIDASPAPTPLPEAIPAIEPKPTPMPAPIAPPITNTSQAPDSPLIAEIRTALTNNGLQLMYQPVIGLHGDPTETYEVMLRMRTRQGQILSAGEFMSAAIQGNLIQAIDHWVVKQAIQTLRDHRSGGKKTSFFINLSDEALHDETLALLVLQELKAANLKGDALIFEINEVTLAEHSQKADAFINSLKRLGCRFAVDNYGSHLSAFFYIQKLPIEFLKLDGFLISGLTNNTVNQTVVQALFQIAKAMDKRIIAKFVEDAESLALLWNYGADYVQGNYFQPPDDHLSYNFAGESIDSDQAVAGWTRNLK